MICSAPFTVPFCIIIHRYIHISNPLPHFRKDCRWFLSCLFLFVAFIYAFCFSQSRLPKPIVFSVDFFIICPPLAIIHCRYEQKMKNYNAARCGIVTLEIQIHPPFTTLVNLYDTIYSLTYSRTHF